MRSSLPPPTKSESRRMEIIKSQVGCIATRFDQLQYTPCEIHHLISEKTGNRISHAATIGLTYEHHQGKDGIHKAKKRFKAKYGSDAELLELTNECIALIEGNIIGGTK